MSSSTTSGCCSRAASRAVRPSCTTLTSWFQRRSRVARLSAASMLSSTTSTRSGRGALATAGSAGGGAPAGGRGGGGGLGGELGGEAHHELAPLAEPRAGGLHPAAVHLDQAAHQGQAHAEASVGTGQ